MTDQTPPDDLEAYIRAHRDRYAPEALKGRLIEAGHDPGAVEAALAAVEGEGPALAWPAPKGDSSSGGPGFARRSALSALALIFATAAFALGMFGIFAGAAGGPPMWLYAVLFPIQIVLVTRWILRRIDSSTGLRQGGWLVTLGWFVVPPIAMLALLGICFGYSSNFGCYFNC
ncbi:MAG: hypothetical protein AABZ33_10235 [Chloroflexota bacterium]